jgi:hypothetical protein
MGCSVGGDNWFLGTTPLKKVPYNTKLQQWLRDWLTASERGESGPVMIEKALCKMYKLRPPDEGA